MDICKGGELAEFRGARGQRKLLEIFFKVSNAVWQQLRNILPWHMFPPIKKMREFDADLNRTYCGNIAISRTFSGFQMNMEGFLEASLLQCLMNFCVGSDNGFVCKLVIICKIMTDGVQVPNLESGGLVATHINHVVLPQEGEMRGGMYADTADGIRSMAVENSALKLNAGSSVTVCMCLGNENFPNMRANLTSHGDDGKFTRSSILGHIEAMTMHGVMEICGLLKIKTANKGGKPFVVIICE